MNHHVFLIKLNLNSSADQNALTQLLKNDGGDVIQTSDGLCVKCSRNESELQKMFEEKGIKNIRLETVDAQSKSLTPDIQAFLKP